MASASVGEEAPAASASASAAHPTLFQAALDKVPRVKDADGAIVTEAFLDLCELVLPLIGECVSEKRGVPAHTHRHTHERVRMDSPLSHAHKHTLQHPAFPPAPASTNK